MSHPRNPESVGIGMIGIGVIGLGVMGATHVRCINAVAARSASASGLGAGPHAPPTPRTLLPSPPPRCRLAAVCDPHPQRRAGKVMTAGNMASIATSETLFDPATTATYEHPEDLLGDPAVHAVHICTPTDTHVELAIRALKAGKHVLVEKPVAISSADVRRVMDAAARTGRLCIPALCMRFWPGWPWVREKIRSGELGEVVSATFQRVGTPPSWSPDFYSDPQRTGGALVDLHIHDADFIRWCFGDPDEVVSTGTPLHLTTLYRYARGPRHVVAEGGWGHAPGFGFRMRYTIALERATVEFDLGRAPTVMLYREGRAEPVTVPAETAYHLEVEHFVVAVAREMAGASGGGGASAADAGPSLQDALGVARLLEAERRSLASRRPEAVAIDSRA